MVAVDQEGVGQRLRQLREDTGLERYELAYFLKMSDNSYRHWESGRTKIPAEAYPVLAELFKVDEGDLLRHLLLGQPLPLTEVRKKASGHYNAKIDDRQSFFADYGKAQLPLNKHMVPVGAA